jgi:hypothetical protein
MSKKQKSGPPSAESVFLRYTPTLVTLLTLLFGLYQYFDSELKSDIRRFNQAYFDEKLTLYKNLSSSVSEVMVDMQMKNVDEFKISYKKFKTYYWSIQLVKDSSYDTLLASIHKFDNLVKHFHTTTSDEINGKRYAEATEVVQAINNELNKLILHELDTINSTDRIFGMVR